MKAGRGEYQPQEIAGYGIDLAVVLQCVRVRACVHVCAVCVYAVSCAAFVLKRLCSTCVYVCACVCVYAMCMCVPAVHARTYLRLCLIGVCSLICVNIYVICKN